MTCSRRPDHAMHLVVDSNYAGYEWTTSFCRGSQIQLTSELAPSISFYSICNLFGGCQMCQASVNISTAVCLLVQACGLSLSKRYDPRLSHCGSLSGFQKSGEVDEISGYLKWMEGKKHQKTAKVSKRTSLNINGIARNDTQRVLPRPVAPPGSWPFSECQPGNRTSGLLKTQSHSENSLLVA